MLKQKIPCLIMALDSNIGMGRNMEIYYKVLKKSQIIQPIMVYSTITSFRNAPKWVHYKNLMEIDNVDHLIKDCKYVRCKKPRSGHRKYSDWVIDAIKYVVQLRLKYGESTIWILDMTAPELEMYMGPHVVQVFHGELFDVGVSYFSNTYSFSKYKLIFVQGNLIRDRIVKRIHLAATDRRFQSIGRVLNDSLYNSEIDKHKTLILYGLNPKNKTIIYAPSWESRKVWPVDSQKNDLKNLIKFLEYAKRNNLNIIIRPHPISLIHHNIEDIYLNIIKKYQNVYFDDSRKNNILGPNLSLFSADILITDLSSIAVDFMSMDKPCIFIYPDKGIGVWGTRIPSFDDVSKVSYTVKNFRGLYSLLDKLIAHKESTRQIKKRHTFVSHSLALTNGKSGLRFKQKLENQFKLINLLDYAKINYIKDYFRFIKKAAFYNIRDKFLNDSS